MRLSRANIPLASEDRTYSQAIKLSSHYNLAPHFRLGFINLQHFCHSRWRNPVRLSKSGSERLVSASKLVLSSFSQMAELTCANFSTFRMVSIEEYKPDMF